MKIFIEGTNVSDDCMEISVGDQCEHVAAQPDCEMIFVQMHGMSVRTLCDGLFSKYATKDDVEIQIGSLKFDARIVFIRCQAMTNSATILFSMPTGRFRIDL